MSDTPPQYDLTRLRRQNVVLGICILCIYLPFFSFLLFDARTFGLIALGAAALAMVIAPVLGIVTLKCLSTDTKQFGVMRHLKPDPTVIRVGVIGCFLLLGGRLVKTVAFVGILQTYPDSSVFNAIYVTGDLVACLGGVMVLGAMMGLVPFFSRLRQVANAPTFGLPVSLLAILLLACLLFLKLWGVFQWAYLAIDETRAAMAAHEPEGLSAILGTPGRSYMQRLVVMFMFGLSLYLVFVITMFVESQRRRIAKGACWNCGQMRTGKDALCTECGESDAPWNSD